MQKVKFINNRDVELEIGVTGFFLLTKIEGTGSADTDLQTTKSAYQDGVSLDDVLLNERVIYLEGLIVGENIADMYEKRQFLSKIFSPKLKKGILRYTNDFGEHEIVCVSDHSPIFGQKMGTHQEFLITLFCPNPYWMDKEYTYDEIVAWIGGMSFPFSFPVSFATKGEPTKNIINIGDVETPVEIIFKGPAVNPKITNLHTGEFIRVKRTLTADDKLIINTEFGNKKVEIETDEIRINAFNYIDLSSTFFQLQPGDNVLEYSTDSLDPSSVSIRYKNRYVGV